ncbi:SoxR reducing system RseC family protein [Enterobacteriaceae bacterium ESL0689]|nr:SoxR reducing system RseC family protein [Enterobacteriaceae bacterium ESL0689]
MIRCWATVVSWDNGIAQVDCEVKTACGGCALHAGCHNPALNQSLSPSCHRMMVASKHPLSVGQKVELGIAENHLLGAALFVYIIPLAGLLVVASLFQFLFASDFVSFCGAVVGSGGGFGLVRWLDGKYHLSQSWQPVIISTGLPPDLLCVEKVFSQ